VSEEEVTCKRAFVLSRDIMKFGIFLGPFHRVGENPTLAMDRDLELIQWLDYLGYDEARIGEHHSADWEIISSRSCSSPWLQTAPVISSSPPA
jgi:alkanesulfonate monooxygenase SsuD/methylene tetrahydromethanopterin reductase-like flavin-dependent oxidoreductase (luciferase family)